ncbi:MAG: ribonuclease HII [Omnitrophica WOR_2 bacterium GWA2_47_8]|nr:MAG: ribonuclease HII [Omnitrophica WOR_2 bacterium GWA2_47_8]
MLDYERKVKKNGFSLIIGIDEAGRGPLAGPVVAAAVALKDFQFKNKIRDSKKLTPLQRESAFHEISDKAYIGVGIISESVIDDKNILQATCHAMSVAVEQLISRLPQDLHDQVLAKTVYLLIDGNYFRSDLPFQYQTIINGDNLSLSIACASVIAKVTRDRILNSYDQVYPQYGFKQHKGYPTEKHIEALKKYGPSLIHRKSFTPNLS